MLRACMIALVASATLVVTGARAQDHAEMSIEKVTVAGNIHVLMGPGGNIAASVGDDGLLLVDDQLAPAADQIRAAIGETAADAAAFILNTHWHHDHTGGNPVWGEEGTIVAHDNVRRRLAEPQRLEALGMSFDALPPSGLPVVTFADSVSVHFNGEEIRAIHAPSGHTDGDSVVWFSGSNVFHMGDLFFNGVFPFIDLESGGDVENLITIVDGWIERIPADAVVIPGHGPVGDREALQRYRDMLETSVGIVRDHADAGRGPDEIIASGDFDSFAEWGRGFINTETWITIVHRGLTAHAD